VRGFGNVGGVVADSLQVLGAEQQVRAEADAARILHHVRQQLAKQRGEQRIDGAIGAPNLQRCSVIAFAISPEHLRKPLAHVRRQRAEAGRQVERRRLLADGDDALGDVLGEVSHALQVAGDAHRGNDLAQVDRHWLPSGKCRNGSFLDLMLENVDASIGGDDLLRQLGISLGQRSRCVSE